MTTTVLLMFLYGGLCLLLYQEDLALVYNPIILLLSVFIGRHLVDGLVYVTVSVFLLRCRPWARSLAIGYSLLLLVVSAWGVVTQLGRPAQLARVMSWLPLLMSGLFLWALSRPQIRAQCARKMLSP